MSINIGRISELYKSIDNHVTEEFRELVREEVKLIVGDLCSNITRFITEDHDINWTNDTMIPFREMLLTRIVQRDESRLRDIVPVLTFINSHLNQVQVSDSDNLGDWLANIRTYVQTHRDEVKNNVGNHTRRNYHTYDESFIEKELTTAMRDIDARYTNMLTYLNEVDTNDTTPISSRLETFMDRLIEMYQSGHIDNMTILELLIMTHQYVNTLSTTE